MSILKITPCFEIIPYMAYFGSIPCMFSKVYTVIIHSCSIYLIFNVYKHIKQWTNIAMQRKKLLKYTCIVSGRGTKDIKKFL